MNRFKGTKGTIILVILACLIVGYYFYLSNNSGKRDSETVNADAEVMTMTQQVLSRNLETNYPPSPREVVKYFSEITQCFYNEEHTDEELKDLGLKMREIYDDELIANQTEEEYLDLLNKDVDEYRSNGRSISGYSPSSSVDVEYFSENGYDWTRLYCIYDVKQDSLIYKTTLCFILRKDENSHYKIYGWEKQDNE